MYKYIVSIEARADLLRIYNFRLSKFGEKQADKYFYQFHDYFQIIAERPYSYETIDHIKIGYRRCVCGSDVIYFKIAENDIIEIVCILGNQDRNNYL
jgi:toxin ParE1/3/4